MRSSSYRSYGRSRGPFLGAITTDDMPSMGMGDPAAEYCVAQGGVVISMQNEYGQYNLCGLPNGVECETWDYYNGLCGEGAAVPENPWPMGPIGAFGWKSVTEVQIEALMTQHGSPGGQNATVILPTTEPGYPNVAGAVNWQLFRTPDGFEALLIVDDKFTNHWYVMEGVPMPGPAGTTQISKATTGGIKWWHVSVLAALVAGAMYLGRKKK